MAKFLTVEDSMQLAAGSFNFLDLVDSFQLQNDCVLDKDINHIFAYYFSFVIDFEGNLVLSLKPLPLQFKQQGVFIDFLKKTRPKDPIDFKDCSVDFVRDIIQIHFFFLSASPAGQNSLCPFPPAL